MVPGRHNSTRILLPRRGNNCNHDPQERRVRYKNRTSLSRRIRMRLGLPISGCNPGLCSHCEGDVDTKGFHLLSVCPFGNERQMTHNAVRNALIDLCRHAGLPTRCEDSSLSKVRQTLRVTTFYQASRLHLILLLRILASMSFWNRNQEKLPK